MKRLHYILLILVAVVLSFGMLQTAKSADLKDQYVYGIAKTQQQSTFFPVSTPKLFGIHRQGCSAVNLVRIPPLPNVKNKDDVNPNPGLLSEIAIRTAVSLYLCYSKGIDQNLTIRELLFPFHHFL
jgi:hypothetical protein